MSTLLKVLIAFGCVVVLAMAYLWFFGVQTFAILGTRSLERTAPGLAIVPSELADKSLATTPGYTFRYANYEFKIPWNDFNSKIASEFHGPQGELVFDSGDTIDVQSSQPKEMVDRILRQNQGNAQALEQFYGKGALKSDYTLKRAVFASSPGKITLSSSKTDAFRQGMLIVLKQTMLANKNVTSLYLVDAPEFKGFQFGDPGGHPADIELDLYSRDVHVDIHFRIPPSSTRHISQPEINRALQTLHMLNKAEPPDVPDAQETE